MTHIFVVPIKIKITQKHVQGRSQIVIEAAESRSMHWLLIMHCKVAYVRKVKYENIPSMDIADGYFLQSHTNQRSYAALLKSLNQICNPMLCVCILKSDIDIGSVDLFTSDLVAALPFYRPIDFVQDSQISIFLLTKICNYPE